MKLWMSCEAMADVGDAFRFARLKLEKAVNFKLEKGGHNLGHFDKWAVIAIIRPDNDPDYDELSRVHKARKVIEFRLKVDHKSFLEGSELARISLLSHMLSRSLDLIPEKQVQRAEIDSIKQVLQEATAELARSNTQIL
jgi:hypothetical protein